MHHGVIGSMIGDLSGREAMDSAEDDPDSTSWCAGGCKTWEDTPEGRERHEELRQRHLKITAS